LQSLIASNLRKMLKKFFNEFGEVIQKYVNRSGMHSNGLQLLEHLLKQVKGGNGMTPNIYHLQTATGYVIM